jgi:ClpP class serine protease
VIDDLQRQFVGHLVEHRKIAPATAATLADGRIYTADQALAHHLIDQIGYPCRTCSTWRAAPPA